jgi:hypothetical protein
VYGLLSSKRFDGWTKLLLATTAATSITGFMFPVHQFLPTHGVGNLSLIVLTIAILARYRFDLAGGWRRTYVVTAVIALYFNVFVLIVQLFWRVPTLKSDRSDSVRAALPARATRRLLIFAFLGIRAAIVLGRNSR